MIKRPHDQLLLTELTTRRNAATRIKECSAARTMRLKSRISIATRKLTPPELHQVAALAESLAARRPTIAKAK